MRRLLGVFCLAIVALVTWCAVWVTLIPAVRGWRTVVVVSGSMEPAIEVGDVLLAEPVDAAPDGLTTGALEPGAVVIFDDPARGQLVTHRVVAITATGNYVTRGDANGIDDSTPVAPDSIVAVGRTLVPMAGLPLIWVREGRWAALASAGVVLIGSARLAPWSLGSGRAPDVGDEPAIPGHPGRISPAGPGSDREVIAVSSLAALAGVVVAVASTLGLMIATVGMVGPLYDGNEPTTISPTGPTPRSTT